MAQVKDTLDFRLRSARRAGNLTSAEVSARLCVNPSTYSRWESGMKNISVEQLEQLAKLFGVTVGWLMGESPLFTDPE